MTMEAALALLAVSAPVTVAIIKFRPSAPSGGVTAREFRLFASMTRDSLNTLRNDVRELRSLITDRLG